MERRELGGRPFAELIRRPVRNCMPVGERLHRRRRRTIGQTVGRHELDRSELPTTGAAAAAQSFEGVSCGSATACVAVNDHNGLTAAWSGGSWRINEQFANQELDYSAVSC